VREVEGFQVREVLEFGGQDADLVLKEVQVLQSFELRVTNGESLKERKYSIKKWVRKKKFREIQIIL